MKLPDNEIQEKLKNLDKWDLFDGSIKKIYEFSDFASALEFVNKVGESAEEFDHHPDIDIRYNKVSLVLSTHSEGGLTTKDFQLAEKIDEIGV